LNGVSRAEEGRADQGSLPAAPAAEVRCSHRLCPSPEKGFAEDRAILSVVSMACSQYLDTSGYINETAGIQNMPSKERGRTINIQWGRQGALYFA